MGQRFLASIGAPAMMIAMVPLMSEPVSGQTPTASTPSATTWAPPRTAWGDPDLQGVWSYATLTPLQRAKQYEGREFLTAQEIAKIEAESTADRPPREGDTGTYNALWFDRGRWVPDRRTSLIVDPADGRLPPLTPEAQQRIAARADYLRAHPADSWLDRSADDRCIMYHGVPPLPTGYNNTYEIFQIPGYVVILDENIHDVRVVPLDGRPHIGPSIRHWNGDSRGHWEGTTLVVETTNYSDKTELRFPSSANTRAVERFTRVSAVTIDFQFTIYDSTVYTRPWTAVLPMTNLPGYKIYEYACHEGNYSLVGILAGARAEEEAAEEAAKKGKGSRPSF